MVDSSIGGQHIQHGYLRQRNAPNYCPTGQHTTQFTDSLFLEFSHLISQPLADHGQVKLQKIKPQIIRDYWIISLELTFYPETTEHNQRTEKPRAELVLMCTLCIFNTEILHNSVSFLLQVPLWFLGILCWVHFLFHSGLTFPFPFQNQILNLLSKCKYKILSQALNG